MLKKISFDNIVTIKKILERNNIRYWIDCGLLLGLYRNKDIISGDERDVDIGINEEDSNRFLEITKEIKESDFKIKKCVFLKDSNKLVGMALKRGMSNGRSHIIDVHIYRHDKKNNTVFFLMGRSVHSGKMRLFVYRHPAEFFKELGVIEWNGIFLPCPKDIEGYLINRYGEDWYINKRENGQWKGPKIFSCNPCLETQVEEMFGQLL
jgi:phosphorylcholine metabolism protein LicD